MSLSLGDMLADPIEYWNWLHDVAAKISVIQAVSQSLILDHVGPDATSSTEVATRANLEEGKARRVLDFLAAEGVLNTDGTGRYIPTERSHQLVSTAPFMLLHKMLLTAAFNLGDALHTRSSKDAWTLAFGKPIFETLAENPGLVETFALGMSFSTAVTEPKIFELHNFQPFRTAVDIGGSHGRLIVRILADHPDARGIVFDLP